MILTFHIIVATLSLILAGIIYFYPSKSKLNATYALASLMLISGFYLILSKPTHMTQTCITGLTCLALISYAIVTARNKLNQEI